MKPSLIIFFLITGFTLHPASDYIIQDISDSTITNSPDTSNAIENLSDTLDTDIPEGLTAEEVIDNYIEAIGGEDKLYNIVDRTTIMRGSVQGVNVIIVSYQKAPNKIKQEIKAGTTDQEIIFNGETGVMIMGGKETEITGTELEKLKYEATIALLPELEHYGITLSFEGIKIVDSVDAYEVIMTLPSGIKWTQYYNTETHLKLKESKYIKTPTGLFEQEIWYDDYTEVEGIKYPFKIRQKIGSQSMEFTVSSIKVNTGVADREFEIK